MERTDGGRRILLLSSHPLDGPDGADRRIALSVARHVPGHFTWFGRLGGRVEPGLEEHRRVAVLSPSGQPGTLERLQIAGRAALLEPGVDLVHAIFSVGRYFATYANARHALPAARRRPVLHTVPGVVDPTYVERGQPLGTTVVFSRTAARDLQAAGWEDVRVVPPGIDLDRWTPWPRGAEDDRPVVLFSGHADAGAGLEDAIDAAAEVQRRGQPIELVLALRPRPGSSVHLTARRVLAATRARGLDRVRIHGVVDDVAGLVRRADVVLLLSRRLAGKATVPLTLLQAMASRRPVLTADIAELRELGDGVLRVPPGDARAAATALIALLTDDAAWEKQARRGEELVEKEYGLDRMLERYSTLYDELLRDAVATGATGGSS